MCFTTRGMKVWKGDVNDLVKKGFGSNQDQELPEGSSVLHDKTFCFFFMTWKSHRNL